MVASLLRGQFAWRPLYGNQLSRNQFAAISCPCLQDFSSVKQVNSLVFKSNVYNVLYISIFTST